MRLDATIKNYRCFARHKPLRITLGDGFTAFVGPNNSGKSSLLRMFYELRGLFGLLGPRSGHLTQALRDRESFDYLGVNDVSEVFCRDSDGDIELAFSYRPADYIGINGLRSDCTLTIIIEHHTNQFKAELRIGNERLTSAQAFEWVGETELRAGLTGRVENLLPFCELFQSLGRTLYIGPFRNALNIPGSSEYFDIPVGREFVQRWNQLKSGNNISHRRRLIAVTDAIQTLFRLTRLEINPSADGNTLIIVLAGGHSYKLAEVGSGLTQFILVFGAAAFADSHFILVDEPEINLHPTLQNAFLTSLRQFATRGVMFGTHNIGLARSVGNRTYVIRREPGSTPEVHRLERVPRLSEFLGELSYGGYLELGFDKVLLVEGVNEVQVIQHWLRQLQKDHRILILHMGGSNLINGRRAPELAEVTRISSKIFALIDSERVSAEAMLTPDRSGFAKACEELGIDCTVLKRRAIENYFPDRAVKAAVGGTSASLQEFEPLSGRWGKALNLRIAQEMTADELMATDDLGNFLQKL